MLVGCLGFMAYQPSSCNDYYEWVNNADHETTILQQEGLRYRGWEIDSREKTM